MSDSTLMTGKEFAMHIGVSPAYVSKLKQAGRLVLEGRRIDAARSKKRIASTRDPARQDVVERVAKKKNGTARPPIDEGGAESEQSLNYATARARREHALAEAAELDLLARKGSLCDADEVERAVLALAAQVRAKFERLADRVAPEVAALTDETKVRAFILEEVDELLEALADESGRAMSGLRKQGG